MLGASTTSNMSILDEIQRMAFERGGYGVSEMGSRPLPRGPKTPRPTGGPAPIPVQGIDALPQPMADTRPTVMPSEVAPPIATDYDPYPVVTTEIVRTPGFEIPLLLLATTAIIIVQKKRK